MRPNCSPTPPNEYVEERLFPVEVPTGVSFLKNAGLVTGPNPDEYEALAGRCPVFRFDPVSP